MILYITEYVIPNITKHNADFNAMMMPAYPYWEKLLGKQFFNEELEHDYQGPQISKRMF